MVSLNVSLVGDVPVLIVEGDVDLGELPAWHRALRHLVADHVGQRVVVDLDGADSIDDAAVGVLLGAAGKARERNGDLQLVCNRGALLARFERSGLSRAITIRSHIYDA